MPGKGARKRRRQLLPRNVERQMKVYKDQIFIKHGPIIACYHCGCLITRLEASVDHLIPIRT